MIAESIGHQAAGRSGQPRAYSPWAGPAPAGVGDGADALRHQAAPERIRS